MGHYITIFRASESNKPTIALILCTGGASLIGGNLDSEGEVGAWRAVDGRQNITGRNIHQLSLILASWVSSFNELEEYINPFYCLSMPN